MRNAILAAILGVAMLLGVGCSAHVNNTVAPPPAPGPDGMLIHLTAGPEDPHRAMMALNMAAMISEHRPVLVYADIEAVRLLTADAPAIEMEPFGSSRDLLATLAARGVTIMACPGCLKKAGCGPADLAPGIRLAEKDAFFAFTDGRIVTLDY
jgi:predicted peroxiredoxin